MKIMFVHGIGFHEGKDDLKKWADAWSSSIKTACKDRGITFNFLDPLGTDGIPNEDRSDAGILYYEDLVGEYKDLNPAQYIQTLTALLKDWMLTEIGGVFTRERDLFGLGIPDELKWKAREIAVWAHNDEMRAALRAHVVKEIRDKDPDIVVAHSFGGLITYDACMFADPDLLADRYYVTIGTQIGHPVLRREYGGRQLPVTARHWFNLYNPGDKVFVRSLEHIKADNFTNIEVQHSRGHDGAAYLGAPKTADRVWKAIVDGQRAPAILVRGMKTGALNKVLQENEKVPRVGNRALLIGIDEYESLEIPPLKGCVNDTFQLSAVLQECDFGSKAIRMLHNRRATRDNLVGQMRWLLDDVRPGDIRFFSFSGHGHRLASYDAAGFADEMEEILVTYEYDFSQVTGLRDRDFQDLYAYLPKDSHFLIFLDCCHAGGIPRDGGPTVRSFAGPSDVEHEYKRWNPDVQMWEQDGLAGKKGLNAGFLPTGKMTEEEANRKFALYYGESGDTRRIGRATQLRDIPYDRYDDISAKLKKVQGKEELIGPYLPTIFMACREAEKASEYVHGSVSYGAYTYAVTLALRDLARNPAAGISYRGLHAAAGSKLNRLGYSQTPDLLGNDAQLDAQIVFQPATKTNSPKTGKTPKKRPTGKKAGK